MMDFLGQTKGIENLLDFDDHKMVSFVFDRESGLTGFISFHRGGLQDPCFGATRICNYPSSKDALKDSLKLSRTMSFKSALAGLKYGGAKAVIIANNIKPVSRNLLLQKYAQKVNYFQGKFITGADVGTNIDDVLIMKKYSPYIVGLKVDPVAYTVLGLSFGIDVCLQEIFGTVDYPSRTFAIQGLGKVGLGILNIIANKTHKIFVADVNEKRIKEAKLKFPEIQIVPPKEIFKKNVDVLVPCALSNCININNINNFRCKIIAGGANCQLENKHIGELLYKLGVLYAPDYVVNAGGIISVVYEYENRKISHDKIVENVSKIKQTLSAIINRSKKENKPTNIVADEMAQKIADKRI